MPFYREGSGFDVGGDLGTSASIGWVNASCMVTARQIHYSQPGAHLLCWGMSVASAASAGAVRMVVDWVETNNCSCTVNLPAADLDISVVSASAQGVLPVNFMAGATARYYISATAGMTGRPVFNYFVTLLGE